MRAQYQGVRRWSPLLTASAAAFRDDRVLLVKRTDTGLWCLPRDVVPTRELMAESAQRSLRDQAGITGEATSLLGVSDSRTWSYPAKSQFYQAVFRVEPKHDRSLDSAEGETRLANADEITTLSPGVDPIVPKVLDLHRGEVRAPYFDLGDHRQSPSAPGETAKASPSERPGFLGEALRISHDLDEIGTNGAEAPEHPYAVERYLQVVSLSARLAEAVKAWSPNELLAPYEDNLGQQGLGLGAFATAFRDGQILLIRREDTGLWAMPAGNADVGETWANCAARELQEETSVGGRAVELLALFDMRVFREPPRPLILDAFLVEPDRDAEPKAMPEALGAGYFAVDALLETSPGSTVHTAIDLCEGRVPRPHVNLAN